MANDRSSYSAIRMFLSQILWAARWTCLITADYLGGRWESGEALANCDRCPIAENEFANRGSTDCINEERPLDVIGSNSHTYFVSLVGYSAVFHYRTALELRKMRRRIGSYSFRKQSETPFNSYEHLFQESLLKNLTTFKAD